MFASFAQLVAISLAAIQIGQADASPTLLPRQAGLVPPNSTITTDSAYPTDVGYLGTTKEGYAPFLAQRDRINSTELSAASVELRYTPANATNSSSSSSDSSSSSSSQSNYNTTIAHLWGNTSPYFPSPLFPDTQKYRQLDEQCTIEQVHILHRHGSRYPTSYASEGAPYFGQVVANATAAGNLTVTGPLSFLSNWTYKLGAELLVPLGAQELFDSGVKHYYDYGALYNHTTSPKPVVRTTSQSRILESARYWTAGFFGLDAPNLIDLEIILEGDGFNNTLAPYDTCNNSNSINIGDDYLDATWEKVYLNETVTRLQQYIPSGINLTTKMVYGMQSLCPYETVSLGWSPFCELFTEEEWKGFEYYLDLQFQGDYGFMSPTGKAQGIGYAQELLASLSNSTIPAANVTTQNTTLPTVPQQNISIAFSHDDNLLSVLTALNYTQVAGDYLSGESMNDNRTFVLSHITPFAARIVWEVADCGGEKIIRTILNDALVPMDQGQGCAGNANGTCSLNDFLQYQQEHAYQAANFDYACFGNYTVSGPTISNGTIASNSTSA